MTLPKDASPSAINKPLWLASASPRRVALLAQIGVHPARCLAADIDETPARHETPRAYATRMAYQKAEAISGKGNKGNQGDESAGALVLAADTVVAVGRRILSKAEDEATARDCLRLLSGRGHRVWTGVAIAYQGQYSTRLVESRLRMKVLSNDEINRYIACGEWHGKAGGYAIQGRAAIFITRLVGSYSNVMGLPLYETAALLRGLGYREAEDDA